MAASFVKWQRAERLKFQAGLRALGRGVATRPPRSRRLRYRRQAYLPLLACAAVLGVALGCAVDWLERDRNDQPHIQTIARVEEPPSTRGTAALRHVAPGATIIDGDTLALGGQRIRLHGIDAPESSQTCADGWAAGRLAATRLLALTSGQNVDCQAKDRDRYGRVVATCRVAGQDLGAILVSEGLAWAFTRYSNDYVSQQHKARAERRGVHAHDCMPAWQWRA
jgi:endonuclease YncB( thermonuclease family)